MNNYAFIDAQNVHLGIKSLGWKLDWRKFRVYLKEKYSVTKAYLFIGYLSSNQDLYSLVRHLYENGKLLMVLSPYAETCSKLLKDEAKEKINYMDNLNRKIGLK